MQTLLRLVDETPGQPRRPAGTLRLVSERVTAREVIRRRVEEEVAAYNGKQGEIFQGLVQPTESELALNGYRMKKSRKLDAEEQVRVATNAFERNRIVLLFEDRQLERLDEPVTLTPDATITFLRLIPLVGG